MTATPDERPFWCDVCALDLQSSKALEEHRTGRKHRYRAFQQNLEPYSQGPKCKSSFSWQKHSLFVQLDQETSELSHGMTELFDDIAEEKYQNIVVFTGAGVSTAAGVPDFRSQDGLFETLRNEYGDRFPQARHNPEWLLSRSFANQHPDVWNNIMLPRIQADYNGLQPTPTHCFCAWLHEKGWLRRIYTQNVDGLHTHSSLNISQDLVVECHGSFSRDDFVLYGDDLPRRVFDCCNQDFPLNPSSTESKVDLVLVLGTSLQVKPFCAIPNMAPKGCTRVLVNRRIQDCLRNDYSPTTPQQGFSETAWIGKRKRVPLAPLWNDTKANKKWNQILVESDCDEFVRHFFQSETAKKLGHSLESYSS